jgi:hypothetical protein
MSLVVKGVADQEVYHMVAHIADRELKLPGYKAAPAKPGYTNCNVLEMVSLLGP